MAVAEKSETSGQVKQKRDAMLNVALKMFAKDGYHETDVQKVADAAGVGKGTIYRHFNMKNELFLETAKYCQRQMSQFIHTTKTS